MLSQNVKLKEAVTFNRGNCFQVINLFPPKILNQEQENPSLLWADVFMSRGDYGQSSCKESRFTRKPQGCVLLANSAGFEHINMLVLIPAPSCAGCHFSFRYSVFSPVKWSLQNVISQCCHENLKNKIHALEGAS
jgi:hypothetical protein